MSKQDYARMTEAQYIDYVAKTLEENRRDMDVLRDQSMQQDLGMDQLTEAFAILYDSADLVRDYMYQMNLKKPDRFVKQVEDGWLLQYMADLVEFGVGANGLVFVRHEPSVTSKNGRVLGAEVVEVRPNNDERIPLDLVYLENWQRVDRYFWKEDYERALDEAYRAGP